MNIINIPLIGLEFLKLLYAGFFWGKSIRPNGPINSILSFKWFTFEFYITLRELHIVKTSWTC